MKIDLNVLLEKIKPDHKAICMLKNVAVRCQMYELAAALRGLEVEQFPETEEQKEAKKIGMRMQKLFKLVDIDTKPAACWTVIEVLKRYTENDGKFNAADAAPIISKRKELFDNNYESDN